MKGRNKERGGERGILIVSPRIRLRPASMHVAPKNGKEKKEYKKVNRERERGEENKGEEVFIKSTNSYSPSKVTNA